MRHFKPRQACSNLLAVDMAIINAKACLWTIYAAVGGDFKSFQDLFAWQDRQYQRAECQKWVQDQRRRLYGDEWGAWDDLLG